eukprot:jgi/Hompol1/4674/HPOL_003830-RA
MSITSRAVIAFWLLLCVLYFFDITGKTELVPVRTLLEEQLNETFVLGNMTWQLNKTHYSPGFRQMLSAFFDTATPQPVFYTDVRGSFQDQLNSSSLLPQSSSSSYHQSDPAAAIDFTQITSIKLQLATNATSIPSIIHVAGRMTLSDDHDRYTFESYVHGVHLVQSGSLYLETSTIESELYLHNIPRLMLDETSFNASLAAVTAINQNQIIELRKQLGDGSSTDHHQDSTTPIHASLPKVRCRFSMFVQLHPLPASLEDIKALEQELELNQGLQVIYPPLLMANATLVSSNCNTVLHAANLRGRKSSIYINKGTNAGARSKVSSISIGMMTIMDAYLCIVLLTTAIAMPALFLPFATAAFLKFCLFSVFEMRYLFATIRARQRDGTSIFDGPYLTHVYFYLFLGVFLFYQLAARFSFVVTATVFMLHAFWISQIISNIQRNSRGAFDKAYVLGISITRLLLPTYLWGCPVNVMVIYEPSKLSRVSALVFLVLAQVAVLHIQDWFGPRTFVPHQVQ